MQQANNKDSKKPREIFMWDAPDSNLGEEYRQLSLRPFMVFVGHSTYILIYIRPRPLLYT
jgi:hypothetical protein